MVNVIVKGIGSYRDVIQEPKIILEVPVPAGGIPTVFCALNALDARYEGGIYKNLLKKDGTLDDWSRVLLNGQDIRFLDEEKLVIKEDDHILIMSVLAGG